MQDEPTYQSPRSTVRRVPKRAAYDPSTVHAILDAHYLAQVGFSLDGQPFQLPMLYAREGGVVYLHASVKSRIYRELAAGIPCSLGVTLIDGLVLARSAFHHSVNYRSVVVFGTCAAVTDPAAKREAFARFTDAIVPGRWAECRPIHDHEIAVTGLLAFTIADGAAKVRTGGPVDDAADYQLPIWAGVVPLRTTYGTPEPDQNATAAQPLPDSVQRLRK